MLRLLTQPIFRSARLRLLLPLLVLFGATLAWQIQGVSRAAERAAPTVATPRFCAAANRPAPFETPLALERCEVPLPITVQSGQTLGALLATLGLEPDENRAALAALAGHLDARRLRAGTAGLFYLDGGGKLSALRLDRGDGRVELARGSNGWQGRFTAYQQRLERKAIEGVLSGSLEGAVRAAGGEPRVAYRMADVLQWDLDFTRDLRVGDRFAAVYEERFLDERYVGPGSVLAMTYENRGQRYEAYRFDDAYYDSEGRPLQKMFLRSPLPFSRVTSRFSHARFHPILKVRRPHYGVDYGAPTGTPVRVTAGGTVIFAGRSGGAGRMVKVRHPNGYMSAYLHLSRYGDGIRSGTRVAQGQVIGYVGNSGLSTAPHLDYRVQRNGTWIDPLNLQQTPALPIPEGRMAAFLAARDTLRRVLPESADAPAPFRVAAASRPNSIPGR